jgi:hypothetical protein
VGKSYRRSSATYLQRGRVQQYVGGLHNVRRVRAVVKGIVFGVMIFQGHHERYERFRRNHKGF